MGPFIDYQWDTDTALMKSFSKDSDGYAYFLVAIEVLSLFAHTLDSRQGNIVRLYTVEEKPPPNRTDKCVDFRNAS